MGGEQNKAWKGDREIVHKTKVHKTQWEKLEQKSRRGAQTPAAMSFL